MNPSVPLAIGIAIAAGSFFQGNVGGAVFAATAGAVISLVQLRRTRRSKGR